MGEKYDLRGDILCRCSFCVANKKSLFSNAVRCKKEVTERNSHGNLLSQTRDRFISDAFLKSCEKILKLLSVTLATKK